METDDVSMSASVFRIVEEDLKRIPSQCLAEMIRKVYEVDPMLCPKCGSPAVLMASMSAGG
jgi:hypothetical protein